MHSSNLMVFQIWQPVRCKLDQVLLEDIVVADNLWLMYLVLVVGYVQVT